MLTAEERRAVRQKMKAIDEEWSQKAFVSRDRARSLAFGTSAKEARGEDNAES